MPSIARVVVEIALDREFDYRIPAALRGRIRRGVMVKVPFGSRTVRGYVVSFADRSTIRNLKPLAAVIDEEPLIADRVMDLAHWMADYYAAAVETAVRTVLPSAVRRRGAGFRERLFVMPAAAAADIAVRDDLRRRAPRQAAVLDVLFSDGPMFLQHAARAAGVSAATVRALEDKGLVDIRRRRDERMADCGEVLPTRPLPLTAEQSAALETTLKGAAVTVLFGVTGSGKTEVYLQAIERVINRGQGAIVLVPEISLTPQTVERFRGRFGDRVAVLHSHLSSGERHDEWYRLRDGRARIAVGARSALFAPVRELGLIVVDEEHDGSYKQGEAPRYNARDLAVMRGKIEKCPVVLGSATPSLETFSNALEGKYSMARLTARVDDRRMPELRIVDMRVETEREGRIHLISRELAQAVRSRLARSEQVILFLNRRGFASSLLCPCCGYVARCRECSVAMTFHRRRDQLVCHICGAISAVPPRCPNPECRDPGIRYAGMGTEKVEDVVARVFPGARVARMDSDSMTRKSSYQEVLGDFRSGRIDILVGTQMIAKGLHFPNVTLVGVVHADTGLHLPDFRAGERTYQLLTQVAGRAGRGDVTGEVIVQTYTPFHPAIQAARDMAYDDFADQELAFRRELGYPPYAHLTCVTVRSRKEGEAVEASSELAALVRAELPRVRIGGPAPAPLARAKGYFRYQLIIRARSQKRVSAVLRRAVSGRRWPRGVTMAIDVDALALL